MAYVKFPINCEYPINTFEELKSRAENDDSEALYWLGECYWRGENVTKQTDLASKHFILSALLGCPHSLYKLGELYRVGNVLHKNTRLACDVLQAAYSLGKVKALTTYALILIEDINTNESILEGKIILKYAKNNGDDDADYYIDEYYQDADEMEANIDISDVMKEEWYQQGIEGILTDIEHRIEHYYLVMGDLNFCGSDEWFYGKVTKILTDFKYENDSDSLIDEESNNTVPSSVVVKVKEKKNIGYDVGMAIGEVNSASILYGMRKFNARQAHGYTAERANHLADLLRGKKSVILGNDNAYGGPDRCVDGVFIQSKYCATGYECIQKAFDENGYKYTVGGKPMPIEVPADANIYESAVKSMERRISNGEVPGVSDPAEAKNLVRRGTVSYNQAVKIAKAGTIESITYDAVNGAIASTSAFGISAMVTFAVAIWNGEEWKEALKMSVESGLKVAGTTFVSSIISAQLVRVVNNSVAGTVIEKTSDAIFKHLSPKAAEFYLRAHQYGVINIYNEPMSHASELFKNDLITGTVTIALVSIPSVIDLFRGRISAGQLVKNVAISTASIEGGKVGRAIGSKIGSFLPIPLVGRFLGGIAGAAIGSYLAQNAATSLLDQFIEDDAQRMLLIMEDVFGQMVQDYMLSEEETAVVMEEISGVIDADVLKDMYASGDYEAFAEDLLQEFFEEVSYSRGKVIVPDVQEMLSVTDNILNVIADKYKKIA